MANEITYSASFKSAKNGATLQINSISKTVSMAGNAFVENVQQVGTTTEAITFGTDISNLGYAFFQNLDSTNYVNLSTASPAASATGFCTLGPGEFCLLPVRNTSINAKADGAPVNVLVAACER